VEVAVADCRVTLAAHGRRSMAEFDRVVNESSRGLVRSGRRLPTSLAAFTALPGAGDGDRLGGVTASGPGRLANAVSPASMATWAVGRGSSSNLAQSASADPAQSGDVSLGTGHRCSTHDNESTAT